MSTRSMTRVFALATMMLATFPSSAFAAPTWRGDFETGDLSQWDKADMVAGMPTRLLPVTAGDLGAYGVRQGKYALRVIVQQGDDPISASGNRNELVHGASSNDQYHEGDDIFVGWSTLFPNDFGQSDSWQVFTQFHHTGCCGSPPLEFDVTKEQLQFVLQKEGVFDETVLWSAPLVRGKWHDFVVHVKWSTDATIGFVELWYEGAQVLAKTPARTLFSDGAAYLKQGYYRDAAIAWVGTLYHDGTVQGASLGDVSPTSDDAGAPTGDASVEGGTGDGGGVSEDAGDGAAAPLPAPFSPDAGGADGSIDAGATGSSGACACALSSHADGGRSAWMALALSAVVATFRGRSRSRRET